jgi:hypothetical protein
MTHDFNAFGLGGPTISPCVLRAFELQLNPARKPGTAMRERHWLFRSNTVSIRRKYPDIMFGNSFTSNINLEQYLIEPSNFNRFDMLSNSFFDDPKCITGFLQSFADYDILQNIDCNSISYFQPNLLSPTYSTLRNDVSFLVNLQDNSINKLDFVSNSAYQCLINIEEQTRIAPSMPYRCLLYFHALINSYINKVKSENKLSSNDTIMIPYPIFYVIHPGITAWENFYSINELVAHPKDSNWQKIMPFYFKLIELVGTDVKSFKSTPECELYICLLQGVFSLAPKDLIRIVCDKLARIDESRRQKYIICAYYYIVKSCYTDKLDAETIIGLLGDYFKPFFSPEENKMLGQTLGGLFRAEGKAEAKTEDIIKLLSSKFSNFDEYDFLYSKLLRINDLNKLDNLFDFAIKSKSINDFLLYTNTI